MGVLLNELAAPFALRRLRAARALLDAATPLNTDCGRVCGAACCQPDESGENGMLLLPFEERLYRHVSQEAFPRRIVPDDTVLKGGKRLICEGVCPRALRPFACRIFPLRLKVTGDGDDTRIQAELDPRARAVCPLLERGGLRAMSADFVAAAERAGELLLPDVYMLEWLENEQRLVEEMTRL